MANLGVIDIDVDEPVAKPVDVGVIDISVDEPDVKQEPKPIDFGTIDVSVDEPADNPVDVGVVDIDVDAPPIPGDMSQEDVELFKSLTIPKAPQDPRFLQAPPKMKVVNTAARKPIDITDDGIFFDDGSREDYQAYTPMLEMDSQRDAYETDRILSEMKTDKERVQYLEDIGQSKSASYLKGRNVARNLAGKDPNAAAWAATAAKGLKIGTATVDQVKRVVARMMGDENIGKVESDDAMMSGFLDQFGVDKPWGESRFAQFAEPIAEMALDPAMYLGGEAIAAGTKGLGVANKSSQALYKTGLLSAGGAKLGGRILNSATIGGTLGGADAALHSAAEGDSITETVKNVSKGALAGAALGGGLHAAGSGIKSGSKAGSKAAFGALQSKSTTFEKGIKLWNRAMAELGGMGSNIQHNLSDVKLGNSTLQNLNAHVPMDEQFARARSAMSRNKIKPELLQRLEQDGFNNLSDIDRTNVIRSLPDDVRHQSMLPILYHSNVVDADKLFKAFVKSRAKNVKSVEMPHIENSRAPMTFDELQKSVNPKSWNLFKKTELGDEGIDVAIQLVKESNSIPPKYKNALQEVLEYKRDVYNYASELSNKYGLKNANKKGFSHRQILNNKVHEDGRPFNPSEVERDSLSSKSRVVEITDANVGDYSDFGLPHFVENFKSQHLKTSPGSSSSSIAKIALDLPNKYKDVESVSPAEVSQWFNELERGQTGSRLEARGTINTAGLKNIMADAIERNKHLTPEQRLVKLRKASSNIDSEINAQDMGSIVKHMKDGLYHYNGLRPGAALSAVLDPGQMIAGGNTSTVTRALFDEFNLSEFAKAIPKSAGNIVFRPLKTTAKLIKTGKFKEAGSEILDYTSTLQKTLHTFMDEVNHNSSIRDIALQKQNAKKFKDSMGVDIYERAIKQAKQWIASPKGERPELSGALKQMVELVSNAKLPITKMGQSEVYNRMASQDVGRFFLANQSFMANKLSNSLGMAKEILSKSSSPKARMFAAVSLAQILALTYYVEHMFFRKVRETFRNTESDLPDEDEKKLSDTVGEMARFNEMPSVLSSLFKIKDRLIGDTDRIAAGEDSPDSDTVVSPYLNDISPFITGAVRAAKEGYKSYQDYKKNPK